MVRILPDRVDGVGVLRVVGRAVDPQTMVQLAQRLVEQRIGGGHLVLDLDDLVVDDAASLCAFFSRLSASVGGVAIPTVVADAGTRRLFRACGAGAAGFACFPTLAEAAGVARSTGGDLALS